MEAVFKALADRTRRRLLDRLRLEPGLSLKQLQQGHDMTRQAVTKHLAVLEGANLIVTVWDGREKLHYLNPVPIEQIYARWISNFERPRLDALQHLTSTIRTTKRDDNG